VFIFHCNWCFNTFSHIIWIIVIRLTINNLNFGFLTRNLKFFLLHTKPVLNSKTVVELYNKFLLLKSAKTQKWMIICGNITSEQIICTSQWIFFRKNNRLHLIIKYRLSVFNLKRVIFVFEKQNLIWTFGSQQSPSSAIFNLKILHLTVVIAVFMMGLHDLVTVTVTLVTKRICRVLNWFRFYVNTLFNYSNRQYTTLGAYSS
jgi:hypothetical protein